MTHSFNEVQRYVSTLKDLARESPITGRLDSVAYTTLDLFPEPSVLVVRGTDQSNFTAYVIAELESGKTLYEKVHGPLGELDRAAEAYPFAAQKAFDAWREAVNDIQGAAGIAALVARKEPSFTLPDSFAQKLAR